MDSINWLYVKDIAERAGIQPHDFRTRVSRSRKNPTPGGPPLPDDDGSVMTLPDGRTVDVPVNRRMPRWREDGRIRDWLAAHATRARRSDQGS